MSEPIGMDRAFAILLKININTAEGVEQLKLISSFREAIERNMKLKNMARSNWARYAAAAMSTHKMTVASAAQEADAMIKAEATRFRDA